MVNNYLREIETAIKPGHVHSLCRSFGKVVKNPLFGGDSTEKPNSVKNLRKFYENKDEINRTNQRVPTSDRQTFIAWSNNNKTSVPLSASGKKVSVVSPIRREQSIPLLEEQQITTVLPQMEQTPVASTASTSPISTNASQKQQITAVPPPKHQVSTAPSLPVKQKSNVPPPSIEQEYLKVQREEQSEQNSTRPSTPTADKGTSLPNSCNPSTESNASVAQSETEWIHSNGSILIPAAFGEQLEALDESDANYAKNILKAIQPFLPGSKISMSDLGDEDCVSICGTSTSTSSNLKRSHSKLSLQTVTKAAKPVLKIMAEALGAAILIKIKMSVPSIATATAIVGSVITANPIPVIGGVAVAVSIPPTIWAVKKVRKVIKTRKEKKKLKTKEEEDKKKKE